MSETTGTNPEAPAAPARKRAGSLNSMLIADLRALAGALGISGTSGMKKAQLLEAIKAHQATHGTAPQAAAPKQTQKKAQPKQADSKQADSKPVEEKQAQVKQAETKQSQQQKQRDQQRDQGQQKPDEKQDQQSSRRSGRQQNQQNQAQKQSQQQGQQQSQQQGQQKQGQGQGQQPDQPKGRQQNQQQRQERAAQVADGDDPDTQGDDEGGSRRNRRRRGRERNAARATGRTEPDTTILEDDVLVPAAGILDVLDNYAFVRTSGYLPGTDDVYLSLSMVRKYGLRRGDALVGQVRQPREGERREKFNPMVRIDTVNGTDPENAKDRPEFDAFTPVHPQDRLRLETGPDNMLGRIVDVVAPIGKGQRGLVLSPPRSGKTQVLRSIADAIRHNNPECHIMVVLIDERPEEVTDYQSSIQGEVIASTFDRPAADHVLVAELAVERAKRLVELGHDVVVLLDSLTRLGRAYNVTGPASGRVGHSGVDAVALHPAKRLFGAARNVEDGGSLTMLATALVESGSPLDEAVLDEFNDTYNMELRLRRELAERRLYPPVDVVASGTRREEHLLGPEEEQITWKLRTALMDLEPTVALDRVLVRMNASQNNVEFLTKVQQASEKQLAGG